MSGKPRDGGGGAGTLGVVAAAIVLQVVTGCGAGAQAMNHGATQQPSAPDRHALSPPQPNPQPSPRADAVIYSAPINSTPINTAPIEAVPIATVPPTTTTTPRVDTFCKAKLYSLKSLLSAIESRQHQITEDLPSGDVAGAQMAYDIMQWATAELADTGRALIERCKDTSADAAVEAQVAVGMAQTAWQAVESDCRRRLALQGLDCG